MAYEQILYDVEAGVATITLNRPERLNAWTGTIAAEVKEAMRLASDDAAVRVIVLTGAGRGFCSSSRHGQPAVHPVDRRRDRPLDGGGPRNRAFDPASDPSFHGSHAYFPAVPKPIIASDQRGLRGSRPDR